LRIKICSKCGEEFPATSEYYYVDNRGRKDEFRARCKACELNIQSTYRLKNKEKISKTNKKSYRKHEETIKAKHKIYRQGNKEKVRECINRWTIANKESVKEQAKRYRKNHIERCRETEKIYRKEHAEELKIKSQARKARTLSLPHTLTTSQWELIKLRFNRKCAYCNKELPLTQDHLVPISKGGEYTHNNIIPACGACNSSKRDNIFLDWYPRQPFYSEEREKEILSYLGYKNGIQQLALM